MLDNKDSKLHNNCMSPLSNSTRGNNSVSKEGKIKLVIFIF